MVKVILGSWREAPELVPLWRPQGGGRSEQETCTLGKDGVACWEHLMQGWAWRRWERRGDGSRWHDREPFGRVPGIRDGENRGRRQILTCVVNLNPLQCWREMGWEQ